MFLRNVLLLCLCATASGCATSSVPTETLLGVAPMAMDAVAAAQVDAFTSGTFTAADGTVVPYRVLPPLHARAGQRYPLVLQLHGSGGIGTDNAGQLDRLARSWALPATRERYPAYILVPQFATRSANYGAASPAQAAEPAPVLGAALELTRAFASTHPVDATRIYAVGFSMGGSAAWLAPTLDPSLFAAIMPVSGIAPADRWSAALTPVPALVLHGTADAENPITADRRFVRALQARGAQQVRLREYYGLGHQPPADLVPGAWWRDWMFGQARQRAD